MNNATKWGIPDWQDAHVYPAPTGSDEMLAWAWEFLRRNHEYRTFWAERIEPILNTDQPYPFREITDRFGLVGFAPSPSSKWGIANVSFRAAGVGFAPPKWKTNLALKNSEIAYVFDMTLPLDGQFALALKDAKAVQSMLADRGDFLITFQRAIKDKYVCYLRILDALDVGEESEKIQDYLLGHLDNSGPDYDRRKKFDYYRKVAERLRNRGYLGLAALSATALSGK